MTNRFAVLVTFLVAGAGCKTEEALVASPPPEVTVAAPVERDVVAYAEFTGRTEAVESVEIRARVPGVLERMTFEPSTFVRKGQLLFVIEQEPYIARRDQADADVQTWEAERDRARSDLERLELAIRTNAVSQQEVDRARADLKQAEANLLGSKARLEQAKLDLGYTEVRSPIDGLVGRRLVDMGNLVGSGENTLLTTVVKLRPIYAYFDMSERILLEVIAERGMSLREAQTAAPQERPPVFLGLANEEGWPHEGRIDYLDNTVNPDTGTIQVRGVFSNSDGNLFPGLFARIRVPRGLQKNALLVSERAIGTDLGGKYLLLVGENGVVELRHVELGVLEEGMRVILSGLELGDRYIINGIQRARPGLPVTPKMESAGG